jgi:CheY-like chemotaxis protein
MLGDVALVLLTRLGRRGETDRAETLADARLRRPVKTAELEEALASFASAANTPPAPQPSLAVETPGSGWLAGARILLAEDNTVNQKVAAAMLDRLGCRVDIASNGLEAIEAVARIEYDLVLMDCQMPEVDGFEASRRIRAGEAERGLPRTVIVAMTANAMAGDRDRCIEAGMDDYLAKPVRPDELEFTLLRHLGDRIPVLPAEAPVDPPVEGVPPADVLHQATVAELAMLGPDVLAEVVALFRDEAPGLVETLRTAYAAGDAAALSRTAHTLKGSAAVVGAVRVADLARRADEAGRQRVLDIVPDLLERLAGETAVALAALAAAGAGPTPVSPSGSDSGTRPVAGPHLEAEASRYPYGAPVPAAPASQPFRHARSNP